MADSGLMSSACATPRYFSFRRHIAPWCRQVSVSGPIQVRQRFLRDSLRFCRLLKAMQIVEPFKDRPSPTAVRVIWPRAIEHPRWAPDFGNDVGVYGTTAVIARLVD